MGEGLRVCRKCLPGQGDKEAFYENLSSYIQRMDEELKVSQQTYESRLALCRRCEKLMNGMCRLCGCFVELRAVQKVRKCPDIPAKWKEQTEEEPSDEDF